MIRRLALPTIAFAAAFALAGCDGEDDKKQSAGNDNNITIEEDVSKDNAKAPPLEGQKKTHVKPGYFFTFSFNDMASVNHDGTYSGTVKAYCNRYDDLDLEAYKEKCSEWVMDGLAIRDRVYPSKLHFSVATDNPAIRDYALVTEAMMERAVHPMNSYPIALVKELEFKPNQ